jgi:hypothetical protein
MAEYSSASNSCFREIILRKTDSISSMGAYRSEKKISPAYTEGWIEAIPNAACSSGIFINRPRIYSIIPE